MTTAESATDRAVQAIFTFAAQQMRDGVPRDRIESMLVEQGLDPKSASTVVNRVDQMRASAMSRAGTRNMLVGAAWCIGGIVVTVMTIQAASQAGGTVVVAWGAILFGAIQFIRGLAQYGIMDG